MALEEEESTGAWQSFPVFFDDPFILSKTSKFFLDDA